MAEFEMISVDQMREIQNKDKEDKIDHEWAERISTVPVGAGWKMVRPEEENQRNFKRRINAAAAAPPSFRVLDWYPQETNLPPNTDPKTYVIRVKSIDLKGKAAYEAQKSQNGTSEPQQTPTEPETPNPTSPEPEAAGARRRG